MTLTYFPLRCMYGFEEWIAHINFTGTCYNWNKSSNLALVVVFSKMYL